MFPYPQKQQKEKSSHSCIRAAYKSEGLEQHSIALCEQVTALDYGRIIENMGKVDKDTLARITEAVQVQVGVFDKYN